MKYDELCSATGSGLLPMKVGYFTLSTYVRFTTDKLMKNILHEYIKEKPTDYQTKRYPKTQNFITTPNYNTLKINIAFSFSYGHRL